MSAIIDPPPKALLENVTLIFENMKVYTPLFSYLFTFNFLFDWRLLVILFVYFMKREHQQFIHPSYGRLCGHLLAQLKLRC